MDLSKMDLLVLLLAVLGGYYPDLLCKRLLYGCNATRLVIYVGITHFWVHGHFVRSIGLSFGHTVRE